MGEPVTAESANRIVAQLLFLEAEDPDKDIFLHNSPGGSVYDGLGIFDTMQHVKPDVQTVCVGLAASMGAFLWLLVHLASAAAAALADHDSPALGWCPEPGQRYPHSGR